MVTLGTKMVMMMADWMESCFCWLHFKESQFAGHEGRVYTVAWGNQGELLTASMDRWNSSVSEKSSKISGRSSSGKCKMTSGWTL